MLEACHGKAAMTGYARRHDVRASAQAYETACIQGDAAPIYQFGEGVVDVALTYGKDAIRFPGLSARSISTSTILSTI